MSRSSLAALVLMGLAAACSGCGVYSASSGRVDENIKRVAVRFLENQTAEPNIGIELTDLIIAAIQNDNTLKIVDEESADSVIDGKVTRYTLQEAFARADLTVTEYQVQIAVELTFTIVDTQDKLFERKSFTGQGNYVLDDPQGSTEETARAEAAEMIVRDILAQVVEDW